MKGGRYRVDVHSVFPSFFNSDVTKTASPMLLVNTRFCDVPSLSNRKPKASTPLRATILLLMIYFLSITLRTLNYAKLWTIIPYCG